MPERADWERERQRAGKRARDRETKYMWCVVREGVCVVCVCFRERETGRQIDRVRESVREKQADR